MYARPRTTIFQYRIYFNLFLVQGRVNPVHFLGISIDAVIGIREVFERTPLTYLLIA